MLQGVRQKRRGWQVFYLFTRNNTQMHTVYGLGRLQVGELPVKREWIPPSARPSPTPPSKESGQAVDIEKLWQNFFDDPSQWADIRSQKMNSKQPDWIHKRSKEALWVHSRLTPSWVKGKLAAISQVQKPSAESSGREGMAGDTSMQESATLRNKQLIVPIDSPTGNRSSDSSPVQRRSREGRGLSAIGSDDDIRKLCLNGRPQNVLHILEQRGIDPSSFAYVCLLRRCTNMRDLAEGKHVHAHILKSEYVPTTFVLNALLNMYTKCGSLVDARDVFKKMRKRDMFTWTIMLAGYAKLGQPEEAYEIYEQMHKKGVTLDRITFTTVLTVCASLRSLEKGRKVHAAMIETGIRPDTILGNTLVDMYAKCGNIQKAHKVFKEMDERDVVSWNVMIAGAAQNGFLDEALEFFEEMQQEDLKPDKVTYVCVLTACSSLEQGKLLHSDIAKAGYELDVRVGTALVNMYVKCRNVEAALQVFEKLPQRNVISWTTLIATYAQNGQSERALMMYERMLQEGITADKLVYTTIFNVCASLGDIDKGKQVHDIMIRSGIGTDQIMENALVDMYAKCGRLEDAHQCLKNMHKPDVVSYTALIGGYFQHGQFAKALDVFKDMEEEGVKPNAITFVIVLKACSDLGSLTEGRWIHTRIAVVGLEADPNVRDALFDMYAKCNDVQKASNN